MLIDFTVRNYKSIRDEQTFSMYSSKPKGRHLDNLFPLKNESNISLVKVALVYGANASGKSTLIHALKDFIHFIKNSTEHKVGEPIIYYKPCKVDNKSISASVFFEIEFLCNDNIRYKYSIEFNQTEILKEELIYFPKKQPAGLFKRVKGEKINFFSALKGNKKILESMLIDNVLFLSKAANNNHPQLKEIYSYFKQYLIITQEDKFDNSVFTTHLAYDNYIQLSKLKDLLYSADLKIRDISFTEENRNSPQIKALEEKIAQETDDITKKSYERFKKALEKVSPKFTHSVYENQNEAGSIEFNLSEESLGTQKMYSLAGFILLSLEKGNVLVVDELDSSFHSLMSNYIIKLFLNPKLNERNVQLIASTHDVTLLDLDLLRREQIWFTEKDSYGVTNLFSLDDFDKDKIRDDIPVDKWYMMGRFGAVPMINEFSFLLKMESQEDAKE